MGSGQLVIFHYLLVLSLAIIAETLDEQNITNALNTPITEMYGLILNSSDKYVCIIFHRQWDFSIYRMGLGSCSCEGICLLNTDIWKC